ncbi:hypothetical protein STZ1_10477 [Bacillus subtilis]
MRKGVSVTQIQKALAALYFAIGHRNLNFRWDRNNFLIPWQISQWEIKQYWEISLLKFTC